MKSSFLSTTEDNNHMTWQPIDSAPKDKDVTIRLKDGKEARARYINGHWSGMYAGIFLEFSNEWQPIEWLKTDVEG